MKKFDTLYARNSNGKINEWRVEAQEGFGIDTADIIIYEGLLDGQKSISTRVCKGKNLSKMNETSAYEQACKEAQSRWELKKKKGYKSLEDLTIVFLSEANLYNNNEKGYNGRTIEEILEWSLPKDRTDANDLSKPMKAQPYFKDNGEVRIKFPCFAQPKLNGFRVMARWEKVMEGEGIFAQEVEKVVFRSKEGLRYDILEHIEEDMHQSMFLDSKTGEYTIAYDGEMYIHKEILSEISSAVRKRNSKTSLLRFHIFDLAIEGMNQEDRINHLEDVYNSTSSMGYCKKVRMVPTSNIYSNQEAQSFTDSCIKNGYEGAIFRDRRAIYQFGKRPQTMTKLKRSQDKEFRIVDVTFGDNSPDLAVFVCVAENGNTFKVTPEGSHEVKREYLMNKKNYIGRNLTVKFFERTKDGLPFHAVGIAIRDYE